MIISDVQSYWVKERAKKASGFLQDFYNFTCSILAGSASSKYCVVRFGPSHVIPLSNPDCFSTQSSKFCSKKFEKLFQTKMEQLWRLISRCDNLRTFVGRLFCNCSALRALLLFSYWSVAGSVFLKGHEKLLSANLFGHFSAATEAYSRAKRMFYISWWIVSAPWYVSSTENLSKAKSV